MEQVAKPYRCLGFLGVDSTITWKSASTWCSSTDRICRRRTNIVLVGPTSCWTLEELPNLKTHCNLGFRDVRGFILRLFPGSRLGARASGRELRVFQGVLLGQPVQNALHNFGSILQRYDHASLRECQNWTPEGRQFISCSRAKGGV